MKRGDASRAPEQASEHHCSARPSSDGRLQVTYDHHPLYTFVKDTRKGQTAGEGLDTSRAEWNALSPAGFKVVNPGA